MKLDSYILLWVVMAAVVISLAIYRRVIAGHEDYAIHMKESEALQTVQQASIAKKINKIDFWGEVLTVVTLAAGVVLGSVYLWQVWQDSQVMK
jgi:hypothetical protein